MKVAALLIFLAPLVAAEDAQKPVCNKKTHGQFWPAEANGDREAAGRLMRRGDLEMCMYDTWKYRWKAMSVSVRSLGRDKQAAVPLEKAGRETMVASAAGVNP